MKIKRITYVVSCVLVMHAQAFAPSTRNTHFSRSSIGSQTQVYGLRTFIKRKLGSAAPSLSPPLTTTAEFPLLVENDTVSAETSTSLTAAGSNIRTAAQKSLGSPTPVSESSTGTLTMKRVSEDKKLDEPYTLPPVGDRKLTKLETEFREMLIDFSQFTQRDILAVRSPRMRTIFQGVAASYSLPEVYRAFEVLFEDYAPLRVAGRLIYGKLKSVMIEAQLERQQQVDSVAEATGMSKEDIEASRSAFFKLVVHEDDTATEMTLQQIVDYGLAEMAVEVLGYGSFDEFVMSLNPCEKQKVDFERLMVALQRCPIDNPPPECNPALVLQEIAGRLDSKGGYGRSDSEDQRKIQLNQRYDNMVEKFREWKSLVPNGDGRRIEVLRGCFVGAESPEIVEALRVVYIDYSALRMSGDLIFKVMAALVGRKS